MNSKTKKLKIVSYDEPVDNDTFKQNIEEMNQSENISLESPGERGNNSVSGSTPDLESDDDTLLNAHQMGIAPNADLENPKELNISKNLNDAEKYQRTH